MEKKGYSWNILRDMMAFFMRFFPWNLWGFQKEITDDFWEITNETRGWRSWEMTIDVKMFHGAD